MKTVTKLWIGILVLVVLSPLGLILPARFGAGSAWGEWSVEEIHHLTGYVPQGMRNIAYIWNAPLPDYSLRGQESAGTTALSASYILSAIIGIGLVAGLAYLIGRILAHREHPDAS